MLNHQFQPFKLTYKPTRITATSATLINNILTNCESIIESNTIITDISDHLPTVLMSNLSLHYNHANENKSFYKRIPSDDSVMKFRNRLSQVKW